MGKKTVTGMLLALLILNILTANMIMVAAQEKHDVAVVSVTPSATLVEKGNVLNISVIVENQGDFTETFNLDCTYNENLIDTEINITLNSGVSKNVTFNWNTTKFWDYTSPQKIAATASTVSGETDIEDNTLVSSNRVRVFASPYVGVIPHTTVNSSLTIGTNYTVSIYTDYNGSDITGYEFSLAYNPNVLAGVSVVNDGILSDAISMLGSFDNVAGALSTTSAFYFGAGVVRSGPGILANVTFTVAGLGDSDITLGDNTKLKGWNSTEGLTYNIVSDWEPDDQKLHILHGFFQNEEVIHDVAVVSVTVSPTEVVQGEPVYITVVIENQGTVAEDVTVKVYYDYDPAVSVPIDTKTVLAIAIGENATVNFTWDTTNTLATTRTITAVVSQLPGETDTSDNRLDSNTTVTINEFTEPAITATINIRPDTLNLRNKGQWITAYIKLPESSNVGDIDVSTILLNNTIPAISSRVIGNKLMVRFDRAEVMALLSVGEVTLTITGEVSGTPFEGSDTIIVR